LIYSVRKHIGVKSVYTCSNCILAWHKKWETGNVKERELEFSQACCVWSGHWKEFTAWRIGCRLVECVCVCVCVREKAPLWLCSALVRELPKSLPTDLWSSHSHE